MPPRGAMTMTVVEAHLDSRVESNRFADLPTRVRGVILLVERDPFDLEEEAFAKTVR